VIRQSHPKQPSPVGLIIDRLSSTSPLFTRRLPSPDTWTTLQQPQRLLLLYLHLRTANPLYQTIKMARGKFNKRGGGPRFNAQSAEEIEQRNSRLAELDEERALRRQDSDEGEDDEKKPDDGENPEGEAADKPVADKPVADKPVADKPASDKPASDKPAAHADKFADKGGEIEKVESRKEKQAREKAEHYRKRHEAGLTEEYRKDMEKLVEVRKRREVAEARKQADIEAAELVEEERQATMQVQMAEVEIEDKKSRKSKKVIEKLDKITIKKMKPNEMKDALKERDLSYQGNKKALVDRLLKYEAERTD
jgi:hypothetical protein